MNVLDFRSWFFFFSVLLWPRFAVILKEFCLRNHSHVNNRITHASLDLTPNRLDEQQWQRLKQRLLPLSVLIQLAAWECKRFLNFVKFSS